jgi:membrane protein YqaA with SNARE-associated domain
MLQMMRRWKWQISQWMMRFANNPYAKTILVIHSFADSSFFPITIDLTFIPISIAAPKRSFIFAFWATLGSVLGGVFAYYIGHEFMSTIGRILVENFGNTNTWDELLITFRGDYAVWTLVVASLTPLPFALATMASGVVNMDFATFLIISILGRATRFSLLALLIYYFGPAVQVFLDKYSRLIAIVFFVTLLLFLIFLFI